MPNPVAGIVGGAVGSALIGGSAAKKAAKTQSKAADRAAQLQQSQFEQTRQDQMPFLQSGVGAVNRLNELLGLESQPAYQTTNAPPPRPSSGFLANAMFDRQFDQLGNRQNAMPMARAPRGADFGKYARDFGMQDFEADPGYAFRLAEGQKALDRQAAARGGLISGGALRAATRYGQEMGSQEYTNAFNRYQTERQARLGPLQSLAGVGQSAVNQLGQAGQQYATNAGEALTSGAAARASGYVGAANALTGALGTGLNFYQGQQYMNKFAPGGGTPSGYGVNVPIGANQYTG
jgi:hypothetical protein